MLQIKLIYAKSKTKIIFSMQYTKQQGVFYLIPSTPLLMKHWKNITSSY